MILHIVILLSLSLALITIIQQAFGVATIKMFGQWTLDVRFEPRPQIRFHEVEKFLVRDADTMQTIYGEMKSSVYDLNVRKACV